MSHQQPSKFPPREPRTLVLCFDGTGNSFDDENTNVVRFFSALEKRNRDRQLCYYQPGIGTYVSPTVVWANTFRKLSKVADQALAWYLGGHIMSGYRFLMENYREGDKICLFGFSRGAYTARCLAGMLHKVGLLPKCNEEQIQFAWEQYKGVTEVGKLRAEAFKRTFSTVVDIQFIGVWDTVASVGLFGRHLSFSSSNRIVKTFRHALALDEHRSKFRPNPWHRPAPSSTAARHDPDFGTAVVQDSTVMDWIKPKKHSSFFSVDSIAYDRGLYHAAETDIKEVWFAGCHADVGGGSVSNNVSNSLANPSLSWMVNEVILANTGILFRRDAFEDIPGVAAVVTPKLSHRKPGRIIFEDTGSDADITVQTEGTTAFADTLTRSPLAASNASIDRFSESRAVHRKVPKRLEAPLEEDSNLIGVRQENMVRDAVAPMYDQLKAKPLWWLLEYIPVWEYKQDQKGHWHKGINWNRGAPRQIQRESPYFHASVKLRQARTGGKYQPRAKWPGDPVYVD